MRHDSCPHFTPARHVDGTTENPEYLGECALPSIKYDTYGVAHVVWRAVMGDEETTCREWESK